MNYRMSISKSILIPQILYNLLQTMWIIDILKPYYHWAIRRRTLDVNVSEVFETRREKKCVVINLYKHSKSRETKNSCKIFRQITNRKYKVAAIISENIKPVFQLMKSVIIIYARKRVLKQKNKKKTKNTKFKA